VTTDVQKPNFIPAEKFGCVLVDRPEGFNLICTSQRQNMATKKNETCLQLI